MKQNSKIIIALAGIAVFLCIPEVMRSALNMTGTAWSWTTTIHATSWIVAFLGDYQVWYLILLPSWILIAIVLVSPQPTPFKFTKLYIVFMLAFWLTYDWAWWTIVASATPTAFSWTAVFYFDIPPFAPATPMWAFFTMAIVGFIMGVALLRSVKKPAALIPYILYLIYVYGIGAAALYTPLELICYQWYSGIFIPVLIVAFMAVYFSNVNHIYKKLKRK